MMTGDGEKSQQIFHRAGLGLRRLRAEGIQGVSHDAKPLALRLITE
jgi:hypothetical protein